MRKPSRSLPLPWLWCIAFVVGCGFWPNGVTSAGGGKAEEPVRVAKMKQARDSIEGNLPDEVGRRQQAALAEQRRKLIQRDEKRNQVNRSHAAGNDQAAEPVIGGLQPVERGYRERHVTAPAGISNIGRRCRRTASRLRK